MFAFTFFQNGLLSAGPYLAYFLLSYVFSTMADLFISRKIISATITRKIMNSIGELLEP